MSRSMIRFMILAAVLCAGMAALPLDGAGATRAAAPMAHAHPPPAPDPVSGSAEQFFQPTHVYTLELTITPVDFAKMPPVNGRGGRGMGGWGQAPGQHGSGYPKVPAMLRFDGHNWGPVMIRYKGNSSYRGAQTELKRSFKIDFDVRGKHRRF